MQYKHIQTHTCMCQSRSGGVFGGLWQTLYVSGSDITFPIGCDGAWVWVNKRGFGLGPLPAAWGGRFRDLRQRRRGGVREIGLSEGAGME